ncbi:signal peptidase I [Phenylobacterium sp. J426]|uniref:signal peptidase I n=1 Tax=Phenylobacterium sp. J426 TaxID=2898439 RepID=UPI002151439D|nr:signal peptidase I [Phenylobacterium sp. J426]MCR5873464.1 signal peptidase I [Phenylobacterium sp. J426]
MTQATASATGVAHDLVDTLKTLLLALLIALVLRVLLFQPNTIPSSSMEPGVRTGDYLLISKFDYGWSRHSVPFSPPLPAGRLFARTPERGDVAVFKLPRDTRELYIKRVIGLAGDTVELRGGQVILNGRPLPQQRLGVIEDPEAAGVMVEQVRETGPDGRSYLTYDRGPGYEGDDFGPVVVPQGHYFVLGDNRDNSLDSRWPQAVGVGLVPADNVAGKARRVIVSWREGAAVLKPWTWLDLAPERFLKPLR